MPVTVDRAYLEGMVDSYLAALVAHDPSRLPLAKNVKFTENTIALPVGEALWQTASDLPTYKLVACDPQAGQAGFFALMKENDFPIILAARLKVAGGEIAELETIVVREGQRPIPDDNMKRVKPLYLEALKTEEKVSREEMIRVSDLYFDALEQDNSDIVPLYPECNRVENGTRTTNNHNLFLTPDPDMPTDCAGQINAKTFIYIASIRPRHWTVVDEERGLTFGTFVFHHKGTIRKFTLPDGREKDVIPIAQRPFTVVVMELFKLQNGRIREIEANMVSVPYGAGSGWDD